MTNVQEGTCTFAFILENGISIKSRYTNHIIRRIVNRIKGLFLLLFCTFLVQQAIGQDCRLHGKVVEFIERYPIQGVVIQVQNSENYTVTDSTGKWELYVNPGIHNLEVSHIGYENKVIFEVRANSVRPNQFDILLEESISSVDEAVITAMKPVDESNENQSIATIDIDEIQRIPGATMDISKVVKTLPGVNPVVSFGYNMIVRGGGSFENTFYLNEIKLPAITHFSVQGLSGGPNGIVNSDLIQSAKFNSGAFQAYHNNALSSVTSLEHKIGRRDRIGAKFTLGASEYGAHIEGPLGKKTSYIGSFRKSYTEYLLPAFNVPVIPSFYDYQYNHYFDFNDKNQLEITAIGTSDVYRLNQDGEQTKELLYNVGYIPEGEQQMNVIGARYTHFTENGSYKVIASHDRLNNSAEKFLNNSYQDEDLTLRYNSKDINTRLSTINKYYNKDRTIVYGIDFVQSQFTTDQFAIFAKKNLDRDTSEYETDLRFQQYGFFVSMSNRITPALAYQIGARLDGNSYDNQMSNPLKQFSPRISFTYSINSKITASLQSGLYYQLPPKTIMAFQENNTLVNQDQLLYIQSFLSSAGLNFLLKKNRNLSVEAFYKSYSQYPFLLDDQISYANANGEYVAVGNQPANSSNKGRAYGMELYYQQKLWKNYFGSVTANYIVSEFQTAVGEFIPSAWDSRYFLNVIFGKEFNKNWSLGGKFTISGPTPYTPYDQEVSTLQEFWDINQRGIPDFSQLNSARLSTYHQLDLRVDKRWYLKKTKIILFLDIQNLYNNQFELIPYLTTIKNEEGLNQVDPNDPTRYATEIINSDTGRVLPTIGFSVEF